MLVVPVMIISLMLSKRRWIGASEGTGWHVSSDQYTDEFASSVVLEEFEFAFITVSNGEMLYFGCDKSGQGSILQQNGRGLSKIFAI